MHRVFVAYGIEDVEGAVGFHLKPKADARGQHDGQENTGRFEEYLPIAGVLAAFVQKFKQADAQRSQQGQQKDADDGITKFLKELFPQGRLLGWR